MAGRRAMAARGLHARRRVGCRARTQSTRLSLGVLLAMALCGVGWAAAEAGRETGASKRGDYLGQARAGREGRHLTYLGGAALFSSRSGASKPTRVQESEAPAAIKRRAATPLCGGAPPELVPFRVERSPYDAERLLRAAASATAATQGRRRRLASTIEDSAPSRRRRLLHRTVGYTMMGAGCGKEKITRVPHENDGVGPFVKKNIKNANEEALAKCLQSIDACTFDEARAAATQLPFYKLFHRLKPELHQTGLKRRYKSCALVGNAGHLAKQEWGAFIDNHDVVVRFNNLPNIPYSNHVGNRTSLRIVNHRRSLASCCRGNFPESKEPGSTTAIMVWFPAAQKDILDQCKKRFPSNPGLAMRPQAIKAMVAIMKQAREDLSRLGFGPYGQWRQMTSGAHAVLMYMGLCDSISLYGFTTYLKDKGADQYTAALGGRDGGSKVGQVTKARSGQRWHDWSGEQMVWRLLHASGLAPICSM